MMDHDISTSVFHVNRNYKFPSNYRIFPQQISAINDYIVAIDDANYKSNALVYSLSKHKVIKQLKLDNKPIDAITVRFQSSFMSDSDIDSYSDNEVYLAILQSPELLLLIRKDGHSFEIPLHVPIKRLFFCHFGLGLIENSKLRNFNRISLVQKELMNYSNKTVDFSNMNDNLALSCNAESTIYILCHPLAPLEQVTISQPSNQHNKSKLQQSNGLTSNKFCNRASEMELLAVYNPRINVQDDKVSLICCCYFPDDINSILILRLSRLIHVSGKYSDIRDTDVTDINSSMNSGISELNQSTSDNEGANVSFARDNLLNTSKLSNVSKSKSNSSTLLSGINTSDRKKNLKGNYKRDYQTSILDLDPFSHQNNAFRGVNGRDIVRDSISISTRSSSSKSSMGGSTQSKRSSTLNSPSIIGYVKKELNPGCVQNVGIPFQDDRKECRFQLSFVDSLNLPLDSANYSGNTSSHLNASFSQLFNPDNEVSDVTQIQCILHILRDGGYHRYEIISKQEDSYENMNISFSPAIPSSTEVPIFVISRLPDLALSRVNSVAHITIPFSSTTTSLLQHNAYCNQSTNYSYSNTSLSSSQVIFVPMTLIQGQSGEYLWMFGRNTLLKHFPCKLDRLLISQDDAIANDLKENDVDSIKDCLISGDSYVFDVDMLLLASCQNTSFIVDIVLSICHNLVATYSSNKVKRLIGRINASKQDELRILVNEMTETLMTTVFAALSMPQNEARTSQEVVDAVLMHLTTVFQTDSTDVLTFINSSFCESYVSQFNDLCRQTHSFRCFLRNIIDSVNNDADFKVISLLDCFSNSVVELIEEYKFRLLSLGLDVASSSHHYYQHINKLSQFVNRSISWSLVPSSSTSSTLSSSTVFMSWYDRQISYLNQMFDIIEESPETMSDYMNVLFVDEDVLPSQQYLMSSSLSQLFFKHIKAIFVAYLEERKKGTTASRHHRLSVSLVFASMIINALISTYREHVFSQSGYYNNTEICSDNQDPHMELVHCFPESLQVIFNLSFCLSGSCVDPTWPPYILRYLGRKDIYKNMQANLCNDNASSSRRSDDIDGLGEIEWLSRTRFAEDERVHEVVRILRSSKPQYLKLDRSLGDQAEIENRSKLQLRILVLCRRSLAYCVGRGMLSLGSFVPLTAEPLPIPPLSLTGRLHSTNAIITLDAATAPPELTLWPEFHNGVAAGLRIGHALGERKHLGVTRNWIIYNRTNAIACNEIASHSGLLLALGLHGHLTALTTSDICDYLTQGHNPTTIAILIGCAAGKRGSADAFLSKTLCLHLPTLLPPRHSEIEIASLVQAAAYVGLGLLYSRSNHRLMIEFLLAELSRKPTSECCDTREAMTLAAAWALGMVLLGCSASSTLGSLSIEDRLQLLIDGGSRPNDSMLFPISSRVDNINGNSSTKTSRILERSDLINSTVTSPGATIALALMYIRSNNFNIAQRLSIPSAALELEEIRPDMLLYRAVGMSLIMWDSVQPNADWISDQIPKIIKRTIFKALSSRKIVKPNNLCGFSFIVPSDSSNEGDSTSTLAIATAVMAYLSIVCGLSLGVGLVYAGTGDLRAKNVVLSFLNDLQYLRDHKSSFSIVGDSRSIDVKLLRPHLEMVLCTTSLACSCIMAGSGDLEVFRVLRELRWKVDDVIYGTHQALSMSIGLLFLSGGRASLKRDNESIAYLLFSFLPRFPSRTIDHQYYLQPCRHLYVLAVEYRLLRAENVDTKENLLIPVQIELKSGERKSDITPCLLPELATVHAVHFTASEGSFKESGNALERNATKYFSSSLILPSSSQYGLVELPPLYVKSKSSKFQILNSELKSCDRMMSNDITSFLLTFKDNFNGCEQVNDIIQKLAYDYVRNEN